MKKDQGYEIDTKDITKHKKHVFRLLMILVHRNHIDLDQEIETDVSEFIKQIEIDKRDLRNLRIKSSFEELIDIVKKIYLND